MKWNCIWIWMNLYRPNCEYRMTSFFFLWFSTFVRVFIALNDVSIAQKCFCPQAINQFVNIWCCDLFFSYFIHLFWHIFSHRSLPLSTDITLRNSTLLFCVVKFILCTVYSLFICLYYICCVSGFIFRSSTWFFEFSTRVIQIYIILTKMSLNTGPTRDIHLYLE